MLATSLRSGKPCYRAPRPIQVARAVRRQSTPPPPPVFTYKRLPFEILNIIFENAVAPSFLLDSSLVAGPHSSWCQARNMKLSIIQVSRDWYTAGLGMLYKEVVFRRLNQIPALLESLEESPIILGPLVKTLTLDAFVPSEYGASFSRHMQRFVELCPRLDGLVLSSPCPLPPTATLPKLQPTIKHLTAGPSVSPSELYNLLEFTETNLISLSIHVHDPPEQLPYSASFFELPKLESLTIQVAPAGVDSWPRIPLSMPKLRRFTLEVARGHDAAEQAALKWDAMIPSIIRVCMGFEGLKFLDVNPGFGRRAGKMQDLLDACPNLEHLVVYNGAQIDSHPNIKWVDVCTHKIFGPWDDSEGGYNAALIRLRKSLTHTGFPSLKGTRRIHICAPHLRDIPTRLPPGLVPSPSDGFEFNFPGVYLRYDDKGIQTLRQVDVGPIFDDKEDRDDFTYSLHYDPDDGSDGTSEASERSLGRLRRREVGCDSESSPSSDSEDSECPTRFTLWDTIKYGIQFSNRRR